MPAAGESPAPQRRWLFAGLAIGLVFLWLALRQADLGATWQVLRQVHPGWALAVFAGGTAFMFVKAWRWAIILRHLARPDYGTLARSVYIGTAANLVVAHTGELIRARMIARRVAAPWSAVLATVAIERIFDFIALIILTAVALVLDPRVSPLLWTAGLVSLGFVAIGLSVVLALLRPHPRLQRIGIALLRWIPERPRGWLLRALERGVAGLQALEQPSVVLWAVALSLLQWSCIVAAVAFSTLAVGVAIPVSGAIAVFVLTVIGLTLPSSPAQLGTTQLAFVVGLELIGGSAVSAFAASMVYTVFAVVTMMVLGALLWMAGWRGGVRSVNRP
ncbi:MAG: lysylphosphatidylglycerol synthase transmembrane domain-containing protein [Lautropia sp.]